MSRFEGMIVPFYCYPIPIFPVLASVVLFLYISLTYIDLRS